MDMCWGQMNPLQVGALVDHLGRSTAVGERDHGGALEACWSGEMVEPGWGTLGTITAVEGAGQTAFFFLR